VRLEAAGVNPSDTYRHRGPVPRRGFPHVVTCSDGAGTVDRVSHGRAGTLGRQARVAVHRQCNGRWMVGGTVAEYIPPEGRMATALPDNVSFADGATPGIPGMTAHRCVFVAGPMQGRIVLVTGGAGAVGHYAVQLAAWAGATVIATIGSEAKAERARAVA
jgi:NADPH2:quinone reductase